MFAPAATIMTILGVLVSPKARIALLPIIGIATKGTPAYQIRIYDLIKGMVEASAPNAVNNTVNATTSIATAINVLANDTGRGLVLTVIDTAWIGTVTRSGNNIVYQADSNFAGSADIWYSVTDYVGNTEWARAVVTIIKYDGNPVLKANNDTAIVRQGQSVSVNVLANDVGSGLVLTEVDTAWIGTVTRSSSNITYTAEPNSSGNFADIWYSVTDASGNKEWAQLIVTIIN